MLTVAWLAIKWARRAILPSSEGHKIKKPSRLEWLFDIYFGT